jgi:hypothetical protein
MKRYHLKMGIYLWNFPLYHFWAINRPKKTLYLTPPDRARLGFVVTLLYNEFFSFVSKKKKTKRSLTCGPGHGTTASINRLCACRLKTKVLELLHTTTATFQALREKNNGFTLHLWFSSYKIILPCWPRFKINEWSWVQGVHCLWRFSRER